MKQQSLGLGLGQSSKRTHRHAPGQAPGAGQEPTVQSPDRGLEKLKARIRAKVEHPFQVIKRQWGYVKVRYRGLAKNTAQLHALFALSNLWMVRRKWGAVQASKALSCFWYQWSNRHSVCFKPQRTA